MTEWYVTWQRRDGDRNFAVCNGAIEPRSLKYNQLCVLHRKEMMNKMGDKFELRQRLKVPGGLKKEF